MSIITIVRETVEAVPVSPPLSFGHGPRDYENLRGDDDEHGQDGTGTPSFPMAWLYPFVVNDDIFQSGSMKHEYNLIVDFLQPGDLDASEKQMEALVEEMFERSKQWLLIMKDDPRVKNMTLMRREPLYHFMDTNMFGYACAVRVETEHEVFDYCLPEAKQAVCNVPELSCTELEDLIDAQHACIVPNILSQTLLDNFTAQQQSDLIDALCTAVNVKNSDQTYDVNVDCGDTLVLPDIEHTDSDLAAVVLPAQTPMVCTPSTDDIQIFADFPDGNADEMDIAIVDGVNNGTFDLDAATLTNIAAVVYKKNAAVVSGAQTFAGGDTLTIEITRTIAADASVELDGTF